MELWRIPWHADANKPFYTRQTRDRSVRAPLRVPPRTPIRNATKRRMGGVVEILVPLSFFCFVVSAESWRGVGNRLTDNTFYYNVIKCLQPKQAHTQAKCDRMARLFAQYLAIYTSNICPRALKMVQNFNKYKMNPQKIARPFYIFCQSCKTLAKSGHTDTHLPTRTHSSPHGE